MTSKETEKIIQKGLDEYAEKALEEHEKLLPSEDELVEIIIKYYPSEDFRGCVANRKLAYEIWKTIRR